MEKKAKEILKAIKDQAERNKTYYIISDVYWTYSGSWEMKLALEMNVNEKVWKDMNKLNERYKKICDYVQEIKPNWKEIDRIHFADNSIEVVEVNTKGKERQRMISEPSGDIC